MSDVAQESMTKNRSRRNRHPRYIATMQANAEADSLEEDTRLKEEAKGDDPVAAANARYVLDLKARASAATAAAAARFVRKIRPLLLARRPFVARLPRPVRRSRTRRVVRRGGTTARGDPSREPGPDADLTGVTAAVAQ